MTAAADPVTTLERWERAGAVWRVLAETGRQVTVGLFTCDGGEEVDRFTSDDPVLLRFVAERRDVAAEEPGPG